MNFASYFLAWLEAGNIVSSLFVGTYLSLCFLVVFFWWQMRVAERGRVSEKLEKKNVFEFLHEIGAAFSENVHSSELHRLVVESAVHILQAQGGALYLMSKSEDELVPAFVTENCPPLIPVPEDMLGEEDLLRGFLNMTAIPTDSSSLLGGVLAARRICIFDSEALAQKGLASFAGQAKSVIATPLIYRRKPLGVLALANDAGHTTFASSDVTVFQQICEQSAFAIFTDSIYIEAAERQLLVHDLSIAREIQSSLLPKTPPLIEGYEFRAVNEPARHVSGDYFDYLRVDENHVGVVVADVSGKGIPAALIMAICRSVLRNEAQGNFSAADVLRKVNAQLYPDMKEDMFISMVYCIFEKGTGRMVMARAGHNAPFLFRAATGNIEKLSPRGMAVGIDSGSLFNRQIIDFEVTIEPSDCLLLYTDGSTEAQNLQCEEFGLDRLTSVLYNIAPQGAEAVVSRLTAEVHDFVGDAPKYDDITLLAIRRI